MRAFPKPSVDWFAVFIPVSFVLAYVPSLKNEVALFTCRLLREGANVAVLEPGVAKMFRDSAAVNDALRSLLQESDSTRRLTTRQGGWPASMPPLSGGLAGYQRERV